MGQYKPPLENMFIKEEPSVWRFFFLTRRKIGAISGPVGVYLLYSLGGTLYGNIKILFNKILDISKFV